MTLPIPNQKSNATGVVISLVLAALVLRALNIPQRYELRDGDEAAYMNCSLQLLEGITPGYKYSPAGPQIWAGWLYAGGLSARYMVAPTVEEARVPTAVRPFVALNHALFDLYSDNSNLRLFELWLFMGIYLWAVVAAFQLGMDRGGLAAATFLGGLAAFTPLFVELSVHSRPYATGWALGIVAISLAYRSDSMRGQIGAAILMGIAVGSRIDMLILLPLVWSELWHKRASVPFIRSMVRFNLVAALASYVVAPWLLTNIIGNLRTIATVRLAPPPGGPEPLSHALLDFGWTQGLVVVALLLLAGLVLLPAQPRPRRWVLSIYILLLLLSIFKGTGHGLQHQGPAIIAVMIASTSAVSVLYVRWPRVTWGLVALALLVPVAQTIRLIHHNRQYRRDDATEWVKQHIPPGTIVYLPGSLHDPLPTPAAADAIWDEVMRGDAPTRKFQASMARFQVPTLDIPRALSEDNLMTERVERRRWYILGSRTWIKEPRFDVRLYQLGPVFGVRDVKSDFARTGGVVVARGPDRPQGLGTPLAEWPDGHGSGTAIYASPEVRAKLIDVPPP